MSYRVKEIFKTLQGEGGQAGMAAVFCRFSGCNLWSGHEADRAKAICQFCDTDFVGVNGVGGGVFPDAAKLSEAIAQCWGEETAHRLVVLTGGEPLLQLDASLLDALHAAQFRVAVESNGTLAAPAGIDWLCISPKAGSHWRQQEGDELKLVYPQDDLLPEGLSHLNFKHFFLQPMDGPQQVQNIQAAAEFCQKNPPWRLSLQIHKFIGLP